MLGTPILDLHSTEVEGWGDDYYSGLRNGGPREQELSPRQDPPEIPQSLS